MSGKPGKPVKHFCEVMAKRSRSDQLTGGSRDVSPQFMTLVALSAVGTSNSVGLRDNVFPVPITRIPGNSNRITIIEVLKVFFDLPLLENWHPSSWVAGILYNRSQRVFLTTHDPSGKVLDADDPSVIAWIRQNQSNATADALAGNIVQTFTGPWVFDCTDGAGHGVLVATDRLFVQVYTSNINTNEGTHFDLKVLYRFKEVSLAEYVGIVQGQQ